MKAKFQIIGALAGRAAMFGKKSTTACLPALVDKFADLKVKGQSVEVLLLIAEKMSLNYTSLQVSICRDSECYLYCSCPVVCISQVMKHAFEQKSPKVQSESLDWLGNAVKEFGFL